MLYIALPIYRIIIYDSFCDILFDNSKRAKELIKNNTFEHLFLTKTIPTRQAHTALIVENY